MLLTAGGTYSRINFSSVTSSVSGSLTPAGVGQAGIMNALSGNTTDYVSGANTCIPLVNAPAITLMRLRSYNAIQNPNFEVTQRNIGGIVTIPAGSNNPFLEDRWVCQKNMAAAVFSAQSASVASQNAPGTNFNISQRRMVIAPTTAQATVAAGEYFMLTQNVEGPAARELSNDAMSLSAMVFSTNALKFSLYVRDGAAARSITHLCSIAASTWTVVTWPNIPVFPVPGNVPLNPGGVGYTVGICLCAGSTYTTTPDVWQTGNFVGATGMDNFAASTGNTIYIAFVQHEPGPNCTQLMDKPFIQNLSECQRYYQKTFDYATAVGTATQVGMQTSVSNGAVAVVVGQQPFKCTMAKPPTMTFYSPNNGASAAVYDGTSAGNRATSGPVGIGVNGFGGITLTAATTGTNTIWWHYQADTGW